MIKNTYEINANLFIWDLFRKITYILFCVYVSIDEDVSYFAILMAHDIHELLFDPQINFFALLQTRMNRINASHVICRE